MAKLNFEEYRQPWETGPHWELKREFMEKYQDDFPEDRLLCLAQAYSNMELLQCSYPDPVMLQIHELSKPLHGCKGLREIKNNFPKNEPELKARPGKRNALEDVQKPFKFIKFYSVGNQSSEAADDATLRDNISVDSSKPNNSASSLTTSPSTSSLNGSSDINTKEKQSILSLSQSPDFKLITKIAEASKKCQFKSKHADQQIKQLVEEFNFQKLTHYNVQSTILNNKPVYYTNFYIGNTLICTGKDTTEKSSRLIASHYAMEILTNGSNLPIITLNDLKSTVDKDKLFFLQNILQEVTKPHRAKLASTERVISAIASLKCHFDVSYFMREELNCSLSSRIFYCDLVMKKVLIYTATSSHKKKAKGVADDQVIPTLVNFFSEFPEASECRVLNKSGNMSTHKEPTLSPPLNTDALVPTHTISNMFCKSEESVAISKPFTHSSNSLTQKKDINIKPSSVKATIDSCSSVNTNCFRINYSMLNNSLKSKFAILDQSAIMAATQDLTPQMTLNSSGQICKKSVQFEVYYCNPIPGRPSFRCEVYLGGQVVAEGAGNSKAEAKSLAFKMAVQSLEKQFYTIKVKSELDESFVIKRDQMMKMNVASNVVSDSNVGCRMLKMMGWTGGGIGKTSGITEPITASEHRFNQGLGFSKGQGEQKKFQQNIETLLREFRQTDTTSDLIFAKDFTKDERKIIHKVAIRFGLVGNSKGKKDNRQLFVKHRMSITELLNHLVRAGGCTHKYELVDKSSSPEVKN